MGEGGRRECRDYLRHSLALACMTERTSERRDWRRDWRSYDVFTSMSTRTSEGPDVVQPVAGGAARYGSIDVSICGANVHTPPAPTNRTASPVRSAVRIEGFRVSAQPRPSGVADDARSANPGAPITSGALGRKRALLELRPLTSQAVYYKNFQSPKFGGTAL